MSEDQTLGDPTPTDDATHGDRPPTDRATRPSPIPTEDERPLDVEELLATGRRSTGLARIVMRADLRAEHDKLVAELATLVDDDGNVIVDDDAPLGDQTTQRAYNLDERIRDLQQQMRSSSRYIRFEQMPSDKWPVWFTEHYPDDKDAQQPGGLLEFNIALVAKLAVDPVLDVDQVRQIRTVIGNGQWAEVANKAWETATTGGIDIPKSPSFSPAHRDESLVS